MGPSNTTEKIGDLMSALGSELLSILPSPAFALPRHETSPPVTFVSSRIEGHGGCYKLRAIGFQKDRQNDQNS